jgi:glycine/D-amino acid oxidase-like deaminating enzyme
VAIIGSGIVGLTAAITLKEQQPELRVAIIERGFLPYGASTRNAGFACFGSLTELLDDLEHSTEDEVLALVERRWRGLQRLRERVGDKALRYEQLGGMEVFKAEENDIAQRCLEAMPYFNDKIGRLLSQKNIYENIAANEVQQFDFQGITTIIKNNTEGQIHTGEMMRTLLAMAYAKNILFLNGLTIHQLRDENDAVILTTDKDWHFSVRKVLVCTNGFAKQIIPHLAVQAARNQVIITQPIADLKVKGCFHYDRGYFYFRNIDNRVLLGGGRNLDAATEQTSEFGTTPLIQNALRELLEKVILPKQKNIEIAHTWSGIMGLGEVKKPIIELLSPNVGVAVRMGGMGVAIGSLVGEEGAKMMRF